MLGIEESSATDRPGEGPRVQHLHGAGRAAVALDAPDQALVRVRVRVRVRVGVGVRVSGQGQG